MSEAQDFPTGKTGSVTIFGGGVTGLTVAHELADRGFRVVVIERSKGMNSLGTEDLQLGGMAKTQYMRGEHLQPFDPNRVGQSDEPVFPGEHGFRFFPSYYHHLWDTMQRIPVDPPTAEFDAWKGTPSTVFDNVRPCITQSTFTRGKAPIVTARRPVSSLAELIAGIESVPHFGLQSSDLQTFGVRMLRYMCTSSKRREAEFEDISSYDYLVGAKTRGGPATLEYSDEFLRQMKFQPKVLAAFDAEWGDARTNLSTAVQLSLNTVERQPKTDGVLNGPTTEAWFDPWQAHLKRIGVDIYQGELESLSVDHDGKLQAKLAGPLSSGPESPLSDEEVAEVLAADYLVVALDAPAAEGVSKGLPPIGVPAQLQGYSTRVENDPADPKRGTLSRNPYIQNSIHPWDPFQTLTGIQYFFDSEFQLVHGHMYFSDSPWALSAIFEQDFWDRRPTLKEDGYGSILSVDIGAWHTPSPVLKRSAAECSVSEISKEVWRQIVEAVANVAIDKASELQMMPTPRWFHFDDSIEFEGVGGKAKLNHMPYLIPIVGQYQKRPGAEPWDPAAGHPAEAYQPMSEGLWQAGHGGYLTHWDRLVYAGIYKKTFTRMTTMEAACESARHAVNAIIDHCLAKRSNFTDTRSGLGFDWHVPPGFTTTTFLSPVFQPTEIGSYCQIWNIEDHELPDLAAAKKVDEWFFERGLPHPWEVLGLDSYTTILNWLGSLSTHPVAASEPTKVASGGGGAAPTDPLLDGMRKIRESLEDHAARLEKLYGAGPK